VEIECLLSEDYYQERQSETDCDCCDGGGTVITFDSHENEYSNDCRSCHGSGVIECDDSDSDTWTDDFRYNLERMKLGGLSIKTDGSLPDNGVEITLLFDVSKGYDKLERLCKALNNMDCTVTIECGLHVHIDKTKMPKDVAENIGHNVAAYMEALRQIVAPSRAASRYCADDVSASNRYSAVNLTALNKFGTIEYRLHHGTLNFIKIKNWIDILLACESTVSDSKVRSPYSMAEILPLPLETKQYIIERAEHFKQSRQGA
jgi:hypothetical protein